MQKLAVVGLIVAILLTFVPTSFSCQLFSKTKTEMSEDIVRNYSQEHFYIENVYDCDNMACDVWDILQSQNISARIAVNSINMTDENKHAWVLAEVNPGEYLALETTGGYVVTQSENASYYHGWYFDNPGEMRKFMDLKLEYSIINDFSVTIENEMYNVEMSLNSTSTQNEKDKWIHLFNQLDQIKRSQIEQIADINNQISQLAKPFS